MSNLSASFVPLLAVMSGEAEQMEMEQRSVAEMEASLTALLAGEEFAWARPNEDKRYKFQGVGGPDPEEDTEDQPPADELAPDGSTMDDGQTEDIVTPEQLEMDNDGLDADEALIDGRRRPGVQKELPDPITQNNPGAVRPPPPEAFPTDEFPVPDAVS